jgi:F-type H+-transporting ATPase subunit delta
MQTDSLAQVYAKSLYELAEQAGGREKIMEVNDELEQVSELAADKERFPRFGEFLRSPVIEKSARSRAISSMFRDQVTDLSLRFLLVLNDKERLDHFEPIRKAYEQMVDEAFGRVEVDVYTPTPLGNEEREQISQRIHTALGKEPVIHDYVDESMIGGIRLRIGDQLIDASVSSQLRRMRENLLSGGGEIGDRGIEG